MKNKKGFTLVELLAVIAILAILVIIALPNVMNLFKTAKRNAFETQVRKVAQVSKQKLLTTSNSQKTFDCENLLSGKTFDDCTASVEGSTVVIDALGSGEYSNYLMVDVTDDGESGTLIDLDELKEVKTIDEVPLNETLVKSSKINEPIFKMLTVDEFIDLYSKSVVAMGSSIIDERKEELKTSYNNSMSKISYKDNMIINDTSENLLYAFKINFTNDMLGRYNIVWNNGSELFTNDDMINAGEFNPIALLESYNVSTANEFKLDGVINVTKAQNYYFASQINSGIKNLGFELEKIESNNVLKLIRDKEISIKTTEVKNYKDEGVMNNGKKLNSDEYFAYTRLKDIPGTYKYNYIVKTDKGIRKLTRKITVFGETDSRCFAFNNGTIEHYYYYVNNDSSQARCPMNVVIPKQIKGQNVTEISSGAFTVGCSGSIVKPTSSKNDYEIKFMDCHMSGMGINSVEFPDTLEIVGRDAFYGNNLKSLVIPKSVKEIGYNAFANNELQSVTFEGNINNIKGSCKAFYGIKHSSSVNSIGKNTSWCDR